LEAEGAISPDTAKTPPRDPYSLALFWARHKPAL